MIWIRIHAPHFVVGWPYQKVFIDDALDPLQNETRAELNSANILKWILTNEISLMLTENASSYHLMHCIKLFQLFAWKIFWNFTVFVRAEKNIFFIAEKYADWGECKSWSWRLNWCGEMEFHSEKNGDLARRMKIDGKYSHLTRTLM